MCIRDSFRSTEALTGTRTSNSTSTGGQVDISWKDGRTERVSGGPFDALQENHIEYCRYLRGEAPRPATTLADSRPLVVLNDLAHVSSGTIQPVPAHLVSVVRDEKEQQDYVSVAGLAKTVEAFISRGIWPGYAGWRRDNGEVVTPADLPRFHAVVRWLRTEWHMECIAWAR